MVAVKKTSRAHGLAELISWNGYIKESNLPCASTKIPMSFFTKAEKNNSEVPKGAQKTWNSKCNAVQKGKCQRHSSAWPQINCEAFVTRPAQY